MTNDTSDGEKSLQVSELERLVAAQVYLVHILSRIGSLREAGLLRSPRDFVKELYYSRYVHLYPVSSLFMRPYAGIVADAKLVGKSDQCSSTTERVFTCYTCEDQDRSQELNKAVERLNSRLLTNRAAFIAACVEDASVPMAVKLVWLENYAERIASWAMGLSRKGNSNHYEEGLALSSQLPRHG